MRAHAISCVQHEQACAFKYNNYVVCLVHTLQPRGYELRNICYQTRMCPVDKVHALQHRAHCTHAPRTCHYTYMLQERCSYNHERDTHTHTYTHKYTHMYVGCHSRLNDKPCITGGQLLLACLQSSTQDPKAAWQAALSELLADAESGQAVLGVSLFVSLACSFAKIQQQQQQQQQAADIPAIAAFSTIAEPLVQQVLAFSPDSAAPARQPQQQELPDQQVPVTLRMHTDAVITSIHAAILRAHKLQATASIHTQLHA